jgi:zinc transporter ZupT
VLAALAGCATFAGGQLALRTRRWSNPLLALATGMVIGVAIFDLIPEAIGIGAGQPGVAVLLALTGVSAIGYAVVDRMGNHRSSAFSGMRSVLAPACLTLHSFIDGAGIGLAFQLGSRAGWLVAVAVIAHDLADGVNAVTLARVTGSRGAAKTWLVANTLAPLAGAVLGGRVAMPPALFAMLLSALAGVFLFVGGARLLPRSLAARPQVSTVCIGASGVLLMLAAVRVAHALH